MRYDHAHHTHRRHKHCHLNHVNLSSISDRPSSGTYIKSLLTMDHKQVANTCSSSTGHSIGQKLSTYIFTHVLSMPRGANMRTRAILCQQREATTTQQLLHTRLGMRPGGFSAVCVPQGVRSVLVQCQGARHGFKRPPQVERVQSRC
jgi:hypothetical protein